MSNEQPDWIRLQKALAIEAETGFTDLQGKQYRFSTFLSLTFGKFPTALPGNERRRWQDLAVQFASYPNLVLEDRQHLIAETRKYLYQLQQGEGEGEGEKKYQSPVGNPKSPIVAEVSRSFAPKIDQKLSEVPEIGMRKAANLARLNLDTVRDLLFYYPLDD